MNKAGGGDGIPVELFQILKDDAVKLLYSICQQIWKTQQSPQDWKRSVFIQVQKKYSLLLGYSIEDSFGRQRFLRSISCLLLQTLGVGYEFII